MTLVVRDLGGASTVGHNSMGPLKGVPGGASTKRT